MRGREAEEGVNASATNTHSHPLRAVRCTEVRLKTKVTDQGVLIPRQMLGDAEEVEVRKEHDLILIRLAPSADPIYEFGTQPIVVEVKDASESHDRYLYG